MPRAKCSNVKNRLQYSRFYYSLFSLPRGNIIAEVLDEVDGVDGEPGEAEHEDDDNQKLLCAVLPGGPDHHSRAGTGGAAGRHLPAVQATVDRALA